jgi:antitoxin PrlF
MMARTKLREKGQLTVPEEIRKAARLEVGDPIEVELTEDGILLRPLKTIDPSQAWFWTPEWQAGERQASADIAAGRVLSFATAEEFFAELDAIDAELDGTSR